MRLRSCIAVPVVWAGSCSSDSIPSLGTSIGHECGPKKQKKKKKFLSKITMIKMLRHTKEKEDNMQEQMDDVEIKNSKK